MRTLASNDSDEQNSRGSRAPSKQDAKRLEKRNSVENTTSLGKTSSDKNKVYILDIKACLSNAKKKRGTANDYLEQRLRQSVGLDSKVDSITSDASSLRRST